MKKVKDWFIRNKDELLVAWGTITTFTTIILLVFSIMMAAISNDLVGVVQTKEKELVEANEQIGIWQFQANYYSTLADDVIQTYEDSVPKQQYIQDVEYLESVIMELRYQCELQCGTYNNKEN